MKKFFLKVFLYSIFLAFVVLAIISIQFYSFIKDPLPVEKVLAKETEAKETEAKETVAKETKAKETLETIDPKKMGYVLELSPGTSVQALAKQLENAQLIEHPNFFLVWLYWQGDWNKLKAGEYLVKPGSTINDLIDLLKSGKVIQHAYTIVPGWTFQRLLEEIKAAPKLTHTVQGLSESEIMSQLGHPGEHPEGRFFPETYYFPANTTDLVFLQRAYDLMQQKINGLWPNRTQGLPLKSPYEALILASIVEKESGFLEEYHDIAGVFVKRLEKNMPLQADPTVIYGAGKSYEGVILSDMLKKETPYNTYQNKGLPPTPIAFPSLKAIEATLHPSASGALYFVAKPDGKGHVFSKTLDEHNSAVNEYRKSKKEEG